jgi:hypothetical protein
MVHGPTTEPQSTTTLGGSVKPSRTIAARELGEDTLLAFGLGLWAGNECRVVLACAGLPTQVQHEHLVRALRDVLNVGIDRAVSDASDAHVVRVRDEVRAVLCPGDVHSRARAGQHDHLGAAFATQFSKPKHGTR